MQTQSYQAEEQVLRILLQEGGSLPSPLLSLLRRVLCSSGSLEFTAQLPLTLSFQSSRLQPLVTQLV